MVFCPCATCYVSTPILLAAPTLVQQYRVAAPANQFAALVLLPIALAVLSAAAGVDVRRAFEGLLDHDHDHDHDSKPRPVALAAVALAYGAAVWAFTRATPPTPAVKRVRAFAGDHLRTNPHFCPKAGAPVLLRKLGARAK